MEYITDSGGGEMDQTQNGEVVIGPQPDPNMSVQDAEMDEDEARSEATFRYTVQNFSKLKVSTLYSSFLYSNTRISVFFVLFLDLILYSKDSTSICI